MASDCSLSLELMMHAAQTVDILRLRCRSKLPLLKRRKVAHLNCFVALKKDHCVASAGVNNTQRKRKNWFVFYCKSTVIDCG